MTTFTKSTVAGETPLVEVDPSKRLYKIDPMIYGGFTEHMGRCIYGGIYEPSNPHGLSDPKTGFRTDVLSALRELDIPVIRYPGGNFCATYHWTDGIGPISQRPSRPELAWLGVETNAFGTDEFMAWLSTLSLPGKPGVEPYLCLNMGTGTLDEALAWVEYCNGTLDTYWANKRRANGHPDPYKVRYWALGNEVWGPWQVEQMTKEAYAQKAAQWAKALRLLDPDIQLVLCGETGHSSWDHHVLSECVDWVDLHSIHIYTGAGIEGGGGPHSSSHVKNATAPLTAERAIQIAGGLIDLARIERSAKAGPGAAALTSTGSPSTLSRPAPKICFDEWNVWDPVRAPGDRGAEEKYTLSDALAVAVWLNVFVRQSRWVGMANIAQTVNVISPLMTHPGGIVRQTTWWPLLLFSRYMRGWTVAAHVRLGGAYEGETQPAWLQNVLAETGGAPWLDVSASVGEDGVVSLAVVNIHETEDFEVELKGVVGDGDVTVYLVSGEKLDDVNTEGSEKVGLSESKWQGGGSYTFPKHSFTMLRWKA